jgi:hypothetical protein
MAANRRIFYGIQSIGFSRYGSTTYIEAHGVQNVGITTTFNLEAVSELGQVEIYENIEVLPEIEMTAEKVIDGYPPLICLATAGSPNATLVGRSNVRTTIALNVFSDFQTSASGISISEVILSGMYWASTNFNFAVDGNYTEAFSAVGNDKVWRDIAGGASMLFSGFFTGNDSPFALTAGSGGVQRRQDMIFYPIGNGSPAAESVTTLDENGQLAAFLTILPPDVDGISPSGTNDRDSGGNFSSHLGDITVGVTLGRDAIYEQGRRGPYHRFANFPIEVTTEINVTATKWDNVTALADGIYTTGPNAGNNTTNRSIRIRCREGLFLNLGTKNKLQGTTYSGGDTGGGNVNVQYTYQTQSKLDITHPRDPSGLSWPF